MPAASSSNRDAGRLLSGRPEGPRSQFLGTLSGAAYDVGVKPEQPDTIARNAMHDRWIHTNPLPITSPEQVREFLEMVW